MFSKLERIAESMAHAVLIFNLDGYIILANTSAENILGVPRDEIIGRRCDNQSWSVTTVDGQCIPDEDLPFAKAMKTKKPVYGQEMIVARPDGSQVILSANAGLLYDEDNQISGVSVSFMNTTGRRMAEKLLQQTEQRFRGLLENAQLVAVILDDLGNIVFANKYLLQITGWRWEEVLNENWFTKFIPSEDLWSMTQVFVKAVDEDRVSANYENDILTSSSDRRTIAFNDVYIRNSEGDVIGVASIGEDITEQKRAERELKESENKYRSLIENASDAIFVTDVEGNILEVNKQAEELTGYTKSELLKMNFRDLHLKEEIDLIVAAFREGLKASMGFINDVTILRKDGGTTPVDLTGTVIAVGDTVITQAIVRDISEHKRAFELSAALNDINDLIHSTLDFDEVMRRVVVQAARAMGLGAAAICLRENNGWVVRYVYGHPEEMVGECFTDDEFKGSVLALETKSTIIISDARTDPRVNHDLIERLDVDSYTVVPLVMRGEVIGTMVLIHDQSPVPFADIERDFANKLSSSISLALENARLYTEK
ncbi:MAG: PAS domain S-box protein [Candidatus Aquicultor sp.]